MIDKESFDKLTEALDFVSKFLSGCNQEETKLHNQLLTLEQELCDIEHEIEFSHMSRSERSRMVDRMKDVRIERRYTKELMERMDYCTRLVKDHSKIVASLSTLSYNIKEKTKIQEARVYTPRINKNPASSKIVGKHFSVNKNESGKYSAEECR